MLCILHSHFHNANYIFQWWNFLAAALKCYSCTSVIDIKNFNRGHIPKCSTIEGENNGSYGELKSCTTPDATCFKGIYSNFSIYLFKHSAFKKIDKISPNLLWQYYLLLTADEVLGTTRIIRECATATFKPFVGKCSNIGINMKMCYCDSNGCNVARPAHALQYPTLMIVPGFMLIIIMKF